MEKQISVEPVPASPGYMAWTPDYEELYGTFWGPTPEAARKNHVEYEER